MITSFLFLLADNSATKITWIYWPLEAFLVAQMAESACNVGDPGSIPGSGRSPGGGHGNPLQYSCLQNPMGRGAWRATVHGIAQSWTWLSDQHTHVDLKYSCVCISRSVMSDCDPMDCSPPGSSAHGILQARILEWVAMPFTRGSSQSRDQTRVSSIAGRFFTIWAIRKA